MTDRNNIPLKSGDTIYISKPVKMVDGYPYHDCWIAVVERIEKENGEETLYASCTHANKSFKLKQKDFYEDGKNICKCLTPEDDPDFFLK